MTLPIRSRGLLVKVLVRPGPGQPGLPVGPLSAYLDTGASNTMLDTSVVKSLGLQPMRSVALHVLGREEISFHEAYEVEVTLSEGPPRWLPLTILSGAVYPTGAVLALGRDFLRHVLFTYDGPGKRATLCWAEAAAEDVREDE